MARASLSALARGRTRPDRLGNVATRGAGPREWAPSPALRRCLGSLLALLWPGLAPGQTTAPASRLRIPESQVERRAQEIAAELDQVRQEGDPDARERRQRDGFSAWTTSAIGRNMATGSPCRLPSRTPRCSTKPSAW